MADPSDPLAPPTTPDPFGFRGGPTIKGVYSPMDAWQSANEAALSRTQTFFDMRSEGVLKSFGLGTEIRSFVIPQGNPELAEPSLMSRIEEGAGVLGLPTRIARELYQSTFNEDQPQMTEEQYKKSRYFREGVPWDGAMTEQRAAALAEAFDTSTRREYFASKHPIAGFFGGLMGGAIDPINYIPVAGPAMKAAATYNAMKAFGPAAARWLAPMAVSSFDAATNTAIAALLTQGERGRYGDDISFEATMQQIGMGAIIGAGFGAGHTAWGRFVSGRVDADFVNAHLRIQKENRATLANVKRSLIPLNEAVDRTLHGETPDLSPNGVDAVARSSAEALAKTPDVETVMTKRYSDAGLAPDEAAAAATVTRAFHETHAEKLGITVEEFTARHGLPEVRGGEPTTADLVAGELRQGGRRTIELPDGRVADIQHPYADTFRAVVGGDPTVAPGDYRMVSPFERVEGPRTIGELNVTTSRGAPYATSANVSLKRSGIATALYDAAEASLGRKLVPSPLGISDEAIAFWRSRLARVDPIERQAMLAETLRMGQEAKVGKSTRKLVDRLGYVEPEPIRAEDRFHEADTGAGAGGGGAGEGGAQGAVRAAEEVAAADRLPDLPKQSPGPNRRIVNAAKRYLARLGLPFRRQSEHVAADPARGKRIADAFDQMKHDPNDPQVAAAYRAMISETLAQYRAIKETGLIIERIDSTKMGDPYPLGPKQVLEDLARGHIWFYPTESGFGTVNVITDNPLLAPTDEFVGDHRMLANDIFRVVHDVFGHGREGVGFGASGEENAWQSHVRMYTPLAARAMTSETRGQNSWVNFGPHGEHNRANPRDTIYADQKVGLLPEWASTEGIVDDAAPGTTFYQSAAPLTGFPLRVEGTGPGGQVRLRDLAEALTERHMARYGRALDPADPADHAIILDSLKEDYANQKNMSDNGEAWYVEDIDEAIRVTQAIIPELAVPENRELFLTIAALLSPQQKPLHNWGNAVLAMQGFLRDGSIPTRKPNGKQFGVASHTTGLQLMQHLINTKGLKEALVWVNSPHTGREMAEIRRDSGLFVAKDKLGEYLPGETNLNETKLGIYMMGPKVGDFAQNATGLDPDAITIDLWAMRAYNRVIGRLLDVPEGAVAEGALPDAPRGRGEREQVKQLFREAAEDAGISPSAMQAALWYFEQRLYRTHGIRSDSQNFSGAARAAAERHGVTVGERSAAGRGEAGDLGDAGAGAAEGVREGAAGSGEGQTFYQSGRPDLTEGKFSDRIAELKARRRAFDADVAAATQNGSVRMVSDTNPNEAVLIGPDMSEPGKFRRTHFDEQGPSGHVTYDTMEEALRGTFGLYHPERADARIAGETDKVFAKRVVDKRPEPETLPEKYDDYFIMDKAEIVPIEDLVSSKTAEENAQGGGNAAKRMQAAAKGELSKRDPITVERRADGKYLIKDGNGTYTSVKGYGWKHMPVLVEKAAPDTLFQPDMAQGGGARGSIHFGDVKIVITLFKNADASTALHETGHYFLKLFRQMAEKDGAPAEIAADWAIVKDWWRSNADAVVKDSGVENLDAADVHAVLDNGTTGDAAKDEAIDRGFHEQWARGFERYLREGQAPSPRLARVFEQFKTWLTKIYKKALELNVDISPEIRGVFDRMLGGKETGYKLAEDDFLRPSHKTFDEVYAVAEQRQGELNDIGQSIADELEVTYKTSPDGKPKLRKTAEEKIVTKGYASPSHITDIVRGGFLLDIPEQADAIVTRLAQHFDVMDEGWGVTDAGYFDRKVLVRFDDGTVAEIQLWEPRILDAKEAGGGHALYKEMLKHPEGSPEYVRLQDEQKVLYGAALSEADPSWEPLVEAGRGKGKGSRPYLLKRSRQASSDLSGALSQTSEKLTRVQGSPGLSLANEMKASLSEMAGRPSQLENLIDDIGSPSMREGSTPVSVTQPDTTRAPPEPVPEGLKEATATVGKAETPKDLAAQFGIDLATGEFDELADIEVMREAGRLTPEDEEAIKAADETAEAAEAYGNALKAALFCLV